MTLDNQQVVTAVIGIVISLIVTFAAGGASVLILAVTFMDKLLNSPVVIAWLKHLADSASPELLHLLTDTRELADETLPEAKTTTTTTTTTEPPKNPPTATA